MAHNSVPPGFVSRTSFMLKREKTAEETNSSNVSVDASNEEPVQLDTTSDLTDMDKLKRRRPWILFDQSDLNTEESDSEHFNTDPLTKSCLPKGVTHGCPDCSGCLKVTGRWHPEEARTDLLEEAPLFYPTEEKVEEHRLCSLSYLHLGAPKISYGVPGKYYVNLEAAMSSSFPDSSKEQLPELRRRLVEQISPSTLKSQGVPVFCCVQSPGDKIFYHRHEISDLQLLLEALEGKLDAVYKWGRDDLGLTLHVHTHKNSQNSPGHVDAASDADKQKESISRIRQEVKARILRSSTSNKSNSNDHPTRSLDSATATGNSRSSVSSIMEKVKAHAPRPTTFNEPKAKANIAGPTIITNTTGSNSKLPPKVAVEGTTNNASLLPREAIDLMEGTSDVSSASTSETQPVKSNVPRKLPNGHQMPREPCSQGPILISDDSDG